MFKYSLDHKGHMIVGLACQHKIDLPFQNFTWVINSKAYEKVLHDV